MDPLAGDNRELASKQAGEILFKEMPEDEESWLPDEIAQCGERWYDQIHEQVVPRKGEYLVIDVRSGTFAIDPDHVAAIDRARKKSPDGVFYSIRIGYDDLGTIPMHVRP